MLDEWWTSQDSVRCRTHSLEAALRLGASHLDDAGVDIWHHQWEGIIVTACLWWWGEGATGTACSFGSAAGLDAVNATRAAVDEASQLRYGSDLYIHGGRPVFGPARPNTLLPDQYVDAFHERYPYGDCHATHGKPSMSTTQLMSDLHAVILDYGNLLTDSQGLHVVRTWVPDVKKFSSTSTNAAGLQPLFAPSYA